jgi:hypothetical protein
MTRPKKPKAVSKKSPKGKSKTEKPQPGATLTKPLKKAVPPPDNPLLRYQEFEASREFDSAELAKKRLEAIQQTRHMPVSDDSSETPDKQSPSTSKGDIQHGNEK